MASNQAFRWARRRNEQRRSYDAFVPKLGAVGLRLSDVTLIDAQRSIAIEDTILQRLGERNLRKRLTSYQDISKSDALEIGLRILSGLGASAVAVVFHSSSDFAFECASRRVSDQLSLLIDADQDMVSLSAEEGAIGVCFAREGRVGGESTYQVDIWGEDELKRRM